MKKFLWLCLAALYAFPVLALAAEWQDPVTVVEKPLSPGVTDKLTVKPGLLVLPFSYPYGVETHFGKTWYNTRSGIFAVGADGQFLGWLGPQNGLAAYSNYLVEDGNNLWVDSCSGFSKLDPATLKAFVILPQVYTEYLGDPHNLYFYPDYLLFHTGKFLDLIRRRTYEQTRLIDGLNYNYRLTIMKEALWLDDAKDGVLYRIPLEDLIRHPLHLGVKDTGLKKIALAIPYSDFPLVEPERQRANYFCREEGVFSDIANTKAFHYDMSSKKFVAVPVPTLSPSPYKNGAADKTKNAFHDFYESLGLFYACDNLNGAVDPQGHLWLWAVRDRQSKGALADFDPAGQKTVFYEPPFQPNLQDIDRIKGRLCMSGDFIAVQNALYDRARKKWLLVPLEKGESVAAYGHDGRSFLFLLTKTVEVDEGDEGGEELQLTRVAAVDFKTRDLKFKTIPKDTPLTEVFPGFQEDAWLSGMALASNSNPLEGAALPPQPDALPRPLDDWVEGPRNFGSAHRDGEIIYLGSGGGWSWYTTDQHYTLIGVQSPK